MFNVKIIIKDEEYINQKLIIKLVINNKKIFWDDWIEGVKEFCKYIISNKKYHMVYCEEKNILELITFDNSLFIEKQYKFYAPKYHLLNNKTKNNLSFIFINII